MSDTQVRVEDLQGTEQGRFRGYEGRLMGKPFIGDDNDPTSVRFTMIGNGWAAKVFTQRGEVFEVAAKTTKTPGPKAGASKVHVRRPATAP
jgi:hypothetical protein